jgi:hypothetical protein
MPRELIDEAALDVDHEQRFGHSEAALRRAPRGAMAVRFKRGLSEGNGGAFRRELRHGNGGAFGRDVSQGNDVAIGRELSQGNSGAFRRELSEDKWRCV